MELKERVLKARRWLDTRILEERKNMYNDRRYQTSEDFRTFFQQNRIRPLAALKNLIEEMYQLNTGEKIND